MDKDFWCEAWKKEPEEWWSMTGCFWRSNQGSHGNHGNRGGRGARFTLPLTWFNPFCAAAWWSRPSPSDRDGWHHPQRLSLLGSSFLCVASSPSSSSADITRHSSSLNFDGALSRLVNQAIGGWCHCWLKIFLASHVFFCFACTPGKVRNEWKMGNLRLKKVGWFSNLWIVLLFFMVNCRWRCGGQEGSITSPLGFEVGGERSRPYWVYSLYTLYFIFYFLRPTTFIYLTLRLRYWVAFYWGRCHTGVKQIYGPD